MTEWALEARGVRKIFKSGEERVAALDGVSLAVEQRARLAITGPSGSGKTTLMALCAGLDTPSEGEIYLMGQPLHALSEDERAQTRNRLVGFVFQSFRLLPTLTALENVMVPLELLGVRSAKRSAQDWLDRVGLVARAAHYPSQLSGGEQQRVALARAFVHSPKILFADEPTGNLDGENARRMANLLFRINEEEHAALIVVTHDLKLAEQTGRVLSLRDGRTEEHAA